MKKIILYEYDKRNRDIIIEHLEEIDYVFVSILQGDNLEKELEEMKENIKGFVFDVTPFFRDDEKAQSFSLIVEKIMDNMSDEWPIFFVIDRRYTYNFSDLLFYRISGVEGFEKSIGLVVPQNNDIVSLDEKSFGRVLEQINSKLIGNNRFKQRLEAELRKYRIFNKLGYQHIFSVLICGNSGIGKTEVARILTRALSHTEPFIKINFGNYSDQNALSSLIGSPRGYIGSSKGELSEKLMNSRSKVILIDEFEKSDKQVQNFFLQLLEDGVFTDSLGRDYDLNKYIIIFTANLTSDKISTKISPELASRINLKYSFSLLSSEEKKQYIDNRTESILIDIKKEFNIKLDADVIKDIKNLNVEKYDNMRDINAELMKKISDIIYPKLHKKDII